MRPRAPANPDGVRENCSRFEPSLSVRTGVKPRWSAACQSDLVGILAGALMFPKQRDKVGAWLTATGLKRGCPLRVGIPTLQPALTMTSWLFDPDSPVYTELWRTRRGKRIDLNARNRASIREAMAHTHNKHPSAGQVIAELPFRSWRYLTDAAHEKTLWVTYLNRAFPKGTDRRHIERSLAIVNKVRNRASHHEPLFTPQRFSPRRGCT